jgi:translation elongation factor EF-1beta
LDRGMACWACHGRQPFAFGLKKFAQMVFAN